MTRFFASFLLFHENGCHFSTRKHTYLILTFVCMVVSKDVIIFIKAKNVGIVNHISILLFPIVICTANNRMSLDKKASMATLE